MTERLPAADSESPAGSPEGALSDLVILECVGGVAGAFCGKAFADLGADVIKVEPPDGDPSRRDGPFPNDEPHPEKSGRFLYLNANKRGITLNLESPRGRDVLRELTRSVDALIIDWAPKALHEAGLEWERLHEGNPRLVQSCISPYGLTGPYCDYKGTNLTAYHVGGLGRETPYNQVTDLEAEPPLLGGGFQAEFLTGWTAATTLLAALCARDVTGTGQLADVGAMESVANLLRVTLATASYTGRNPTREKAGFGWVQPCKDGHVSLSPFTLDHWFARFKQMAGKPDWAEEDVFGSLRSRLENADVLETLSEQWLADRSRSEVYELALEHKVPGFPVQSMREVVESEQLRAREFFVEVDHPLAGRVEQPGPPARYSKTPWQIRRPAPLLGQHTREVLCAALGYTGADVVALRRTGIV